MTGVVFYEGPSKIDGKPIVGIATFRSGNAKVGHLIQTWIIRSDIHPMDAINSGADSSVCGNCPLRGRIADASERTVKGKFGGDTANKGRSCYVNVSQAPAAVYKTYKAGKYPILSREHRRLFMGRGLRFGSYGDPVAVPLAAWKLLESLCTGKSHPGYTHQWRNPKFKAWAKKLMASTHTVEDNAEAVAMGWRTFRTVLNLKERTGLEIVCPGSKEAGFKATCETCGACNGRSDMSDVRRSVAIVAHGGDGKMELVEKVIKGRISLSVF